MPTLGRPMMASCSGPAEPLGVHLARRLRDRPLVFPARVLRGSALDRVIELVQAPGRARPRTGLGRPDPAQRPRADRPRPCRPSHLLATSRTGYPRFDAASWAKCSSSGVTPAAGIDQEQDQVGRLDRAARSGPASALPDCRSKDILESPPCRSPVKSRSKKRSLTFAPVPRDARLVVAPEPCGVPTRRLNSVDLPTFGRPDDGDGLEFMVPSRDSCGARAISGISGSPRGWHPQSGQ